MSLKWKFSLWASQKISLLMGFLSRLLMLPMIPFTSWGFSKQRDLGTEGISLPLDRISTIVCFRIGLLCIIFIVEFDWIKLKTLTKAHQRTVFYNVFQFVYFINGIYHLISSQQVIYFWIYALETFWTCILNQVIYSL